MARVYADVNQQMPKSYWDYDSVNISWGVLENYEVVRKIGMSIPKKRDRWRTQGLLMTRSVVDGLRCRGNASERYCGAKTNFSYLFIH